MNRMACQAASTLSLRVTFLDWENAFCFEMPNPHLPEIILSRVKEQIRRAS
jgi:hypothetical protein